MNLIVDRRREYLARCADWLVGDDVDERRRIGLLVKADAQLSRQQRQDRDAPHISRYGWNKPGRLYHLKRRSA